jgi:hypothetical protein
LFSVFWCGFFASSLLAKEGRKMPNKTRLSIDEQMTRLCYQFPSLRSGVPGVAPWDALLLHDSLTDTMPRGLVITGAFALHVWDHKGPWLYMFDVFEALHVWDDVHCRAFWAWAADPYYF